MPEVGFTTPDRIFIRVDLPAPFSAEQRGDLAAVDIEVDALEGVDVAVQFGDVAGRQHRIVGPGPGIERRAHWTSSFTGVTTQLFASVSWKAPTTEVVLPDSLLASILDRTCFFISLFRADAAF